jgi:glycosyltransferase involved in cell wall biosynthesis
MISNNRILWKKIGIKFCTFLPNPTSFELNEIKISDLKNKNILMIGRSDRIKRYEIGINAMKNVIKKEPNAKLYIIGISNDKYSNFLKKYTIKLGLNNNIIFKKLTHNTHQYYKNCSIFLLTSRFEGFPMALTESKIYGLPSIVVEMNYLSNAKNGVINIRENNPKIIGNEILKLLNNKEYRELEGKKARQSIKDFLNEEIYKRWIEIFIAVKQGDKIIEKYIYKYDKYNEEQDFKENEILYEKIFYKNINTYKEFTNKI